MQSKWYYRRDWMIDAKCRGNTSGQMDSENRGRGQEEWAKKYCSSCPVERECAAYAIKTQACGMIHAGVPIPEQVGTKHWRAAMKKLEVIANGG
jgi:hypothetical protein